VSVLALDTLLLYEAVAVGRVASAIPGAALPAGLTVTCSRSDLTVRVIDADFCLAARVATAFPAPSPVQITFAAPGFGSRTETVTIDPGARPLQIGELDLVPDPVRIQGRVVASDTGTPLGGARVLSVDDPTIGIPPPEHTIALSRPLAQDHPAGASVERLSASTAGPATALTAPAVAGTTTLTLATRTGLAAGAVLGIGPTPAGDFAEYVEVTDPGAAPLSAAGPVAVREPLTQTLALGASVSALTLAATASTPLATASAAGEAVVVAPDQLTGLVRIEPGATEEYRTVGTATGADGYFRLDGVGSVLSLWLAAEAAGRQTGFRLLTVPYPVPVTVVDFKLSP
jgi:hypothetical protein